MANVIELKAYAEKRTYLDTETGTAYPYYAIHLDVDGQLIKLSIPKESKQLLNYLLDSRTNKG